MNLDQVELTRRHDLRSQGVEEEQAIDKEVSPINGKQDPPIFWLVSINLVKKS